MIKDANDLTGKVVTELLLQHMERFNENKEEKDLKHPASYPVMLCMRN